jgi:hypothetical protein
MGNIWTDERNRLQTDTVKAELQTKLNFDMSCTEFADFIKKYPAVLSAAKGEKKYKFLNK